MKPHLPLRLFRAVFSCLATVSCLTLGSGIAWAEEQASIILGEQDTLTIDYADAETLPDVGGILQLLGGTQLNLSNCGEGDGKTYTLATGVSALLDAEGNELVLDSGNNAISHYFDTTQPGVGFWADATLSLSEDGTLQLVRHHETVKAAQTITTRQTETLVYNYYEGISFEDITGSPIGGAINGSTITLSDNGSVTFSGNTASSRDASGGAINGGTITLSGNGSVEFSGNTVSATYDFDHVFAYGGAISGYATITLSDNGSVTFSGNTASSDDLTTGGAIEGYTITLSGNGSVEFSGNTASSSDLYAMGGAIYGSTIELSGNGSVEFSGNTASASSDLYAMGGAIYVSTIELSGNGYGSTIELSGNGSVTFSGNTASGTFAMGGAISGDAGSTITLSGNGSVTFSGNSASSTDGAVQGGAIYSGGSVIITGNDEVTFAQNLEKSGTAYRLRSLYLAGDDSTDKLTLSAGKGQSIRFYDSVYMGAKGSVALNADYTDADGVTRKATGTILFSGATTEDDLKDAKGGVAGTEEEILNSRTTEVHTMTNLYGGRLRVEDGAIYKGNGITVHEGSAASVLLKDAELSHTGYDITFNAGTTLELSGHNTITAAHLNMEDGSIMSFRMDKDNAAEGALTYTGNFNMGNKLVLNLNLDSNMASSGRTALMTFANGPDAGNWKAEHVVVNDLSGKGYGATELIWDGNTLYLSHAKLDDNGTADWEGGDGRWDGISGNWGQGDNMFSFTGQVDLFFGDKGSGTITIAGSFSTGDIHVNNSEGNDYHWKNDDKHAGCLHGDHSFHKEGKGDLTVDVELSYTGTTQVDGGTLTLNGSADLTGTFSNNGKLVINGSTTLGGDYEGSGDIEITGKLKLDKHDIEIGKGKDKDKADVHNNGKGNDDNIFSADNEDYEIKNGHVVAKGQNGNNGNNGLHLGNKLTDTSVENAGEETLVITHGENSLNGVHANKGNVEVYGKDKHRLQDITISGNLSVSFMTTGWEEGIDEYREAEISIFGTADFESNAILIADLILESGCKLTMDGAVHMGSDVTLNLGTTLNGRLYEDALNLAHAGEYVVLFDSVDSLILNNGTTSITYAPGELTLEDDVAANIYFTNLGEDSNIYITFVPGDTPVGGETGTTGGEIRLTLGKDSDSDAVPEPTSSMLGLMGLVAFTLRRRRK